MNISIFGSGYVGLVAATCFSDAGHRVMCADIDSDRIAKLNKGISPIYEPGIEDLLLRNLEKQTLAFTTDSAAAVEFGEVIFIAVGTPTAFDGATDISQVVAVANAIGNTMITEKIIVNKSTAPVGTVDNICAIIAKRLEIRSLAVSFDVCSNPEFMKEGSAIEDFTRAARIVVGCDSERARAALKRCYAPSNPRQAKLIFLDPPSA